MKEIDLNLNENPFINFFQQDMQCQQELMWKRCGNGVMKMTSPFL